MDPRLYHDPLKGMARSHAQAFAPPAAGAQHRTESYQVRTERRRRVAKASTAIFPKASLRKEKCTKVQKPEERPPGNNHTRLPEQWNDFCSCEPCSFFDEETLYVQGRKAKTLTYLSRVRQAEQWPITRGIAITAIRGFRMGLPSQGGDNGADGGDFWIQ